MRGKRLDIQGLRALAVLAVIANHLIGWPRGGFIGVDIFFVVSGFLITGLLLREHQRTGGISYRGFYSRRIKRIIPAAITVGLITVIVAFLIFPLVRAKNVMTDAFWASFFSANWRFISTGTDYMHATDSLSPMQHYWSLAVEEQFYLLWPIVMFAVLYFAKRYPWRAITVTMGVIAAASFVWALWESTTHPTSAYFSTFSRAWELAAGALLACAAPALTKVPKAVRYWMGWGGLAVLLAAIVLISDVLTFPAPWALAPVIGTMLIISAGIGSTVSAPFPLTNRVAVYLGGISFSLYLWHLPVIVFVGALLPQRGEKYLVLSLALILLLAVLTYHWIEEPFRKASWTWKGLTARPAVSRARRIALPVLLVACVSLGFATYQSRLPEAAAAVSIDTLLENSQDSAAQKLRSADIREALDAQEWPQLTPAIADLGPDSRASEWVADGCLGLEATNGLSPEDNAIRCVYGNPNAPQTMAVMGDSQAISYVPGLRAAIGDDWKIQVYSMSQCPAVDVQILFGDGSAAPVCGEFRDWTLNQISNAKPEMVILVSAPGAVQRLASGATGEQAAQEWADGIAATYNALDGLNVVSLDTPPTMKSIQECAIAGSSPSDCVSSPDQAFIDAGVDTRTVASGYANVTVPSTISWFCSADGLCPAFIDGTPSLVDGGHLSNAASRALGPLLKVALGLDKVRG